MKNQVAIGIDVGGTHLKCAVVNSAGKILHQHQVSSLSQKKSSIILENLLFHLREEEAWATDHGYRVAGIGLGVPGIVEHPHGIVRQSPHFLTWKNYPVLKKLKQKLAFPIWVDNDANHAALGELWQGAGKNKKNFILLTLGTGIGGGIILNRKLWQGDSGFAGELGHLVIEKKGKSCNCGGKGCLEKYASSEVFKKDPEQMYQLAKEGDRFALQEWKKFGEALGVGVASIVNALDIETILIGGGLSGAWNYFNQSMHQSIKNHLYAHTAKRVKIQKAKLGNRAGVMGCAYRVFEGLSSE